MAFCPAPSGQFIVIREMLPVRSSWGLRSKLCVRSHPTPLFVDPKVSNKHHAWFCREGGDGTGDRVSPSLHRPQRVLDIHPWAGPD